MWVLVLKQMEELSFLNLILETCQVVLPLSSGGSRTVGCAGGTGGLGQWFLDEALFPCSS